MRITSVFAFPNGNVAVFNGEEQVPELQCNVLKPDDPYYKDKIPKLVEAIILNNPDFNDMIGVLAKMVKDAGVLTHD